MTKEQLKSNEFVISMTMDKMKVSRKVAEERVKALFLSGILKEGNPVDRYTQLRIENFLRFDLSKLDYTNVFYETLNFPAFISEYDKMTGNNMSLAMIQIRTETETDETEVQLGRFEDFFKANIWAHFPGGSKYDKQ